MAALGSMKLSRPPQVMAGVRRTMSSDDAVIKEDPEACTVSIDELIVNGWLVKDVRCPGCRGPVVHDTDFDARFCPGCDTWLEGLCHDPECSYCPARPSRPLARALS